MGCVFDDDDEDDDEDECPSFVFWLGWFEILKYHSKFSMGLGMMGFLHLFLVTCISFFAFYFNTRDFFSSLSPVQVVYCSSLGSDHLISFGCETPNSSVEVAVILLMVQKSG